MKIIIDIYSEHVKKTKLFWKKKAQVVQLIEAEWHIYVFVN